MIEKIQSLQEKMLENERRMNEQKNKTEVQLINQLREVIVTQLALNPQLLSQ